MPLGLYVAVARQPVGGVKCVNGPSKSVVVTDILVTQGVQDQEMCGAPWSCKACSSIKRAASAHGSALFGCLRLRASSLGAVWPQG
jgi:hypothetical protein